MDTNKEDVLADISSSLQRALQSMLPCQTPALVAALHNINNRKLACEANPEYGQVLLTSFDNAQLKNLNTVAGSGNKGYKESVVKSYAFQQDIKNIKTVEAEIEVVRSTMAEVSRLVLTTTFSNEKGEIGWTDIQERILDILTRRSNEQGVAAAEAKAKAKAAPAAPAAPMQEG